MSNRKGGKIAKGIIIELFAYPLCPLRLCGYMFLLHDKFKKYLRSLIEEEIGK